MERQDQHHVIVNEDVLNVLYRVEKKFAHHACLDIHFKMVNVQCVLLDTIQKEDLLSAHLVQIYNGHLKEHQHAILVQRIVSNVNRN